jgi:ATP-dependent DNA helicase RecQ
MLYGLADIRMRRMFIEQENAGEDRKRREQQRLNALIGYCEAAGCRRTVLLNYFGEASEPCGNCDLCADPGALIDGTEDARKILQAVRQTGERYGAGHVADVLRGMHGEKVIAAGHDRLAAFGTGVARKKDEWQSLIRQLVAGGFLHLDVAGYGGMALTAKGRALLTGTEAFQHRPPLRRADRKTRDAVNTAPLTGDETSLLAVLKELRLRLAKQRRVPAYVIFSDRTLLDMAQRRPQTETEFAEVNGVGAKKLQEFGTVFLKAIREA